MTDENLVRALNAFTRRRPFVPFLIQLMSGEMIRIAHPEAIRPRGTVLQHVEPNYRQRLFDSASVCQLLDLPDDTQQSNGDSGDLSEEDLS